MEKDPKLEKAILIALRDCNNPDDIWQDMVIKGFDLELIHEHFRMLYETGMIDAINASSFNGNKYIPQRLTALGHAYLLEIDKSWSTKFFSLVLHTSGKIVWIFVGAFIGAVATWAAGKMLGACL